MLVGSGLCVMSLCNSKQGSVIHFQRKHRGVILKSTEHWHFLRGQTSRSRAIHHRRTESIHGMNHKHRSYLSIFVLMALLTMNEIHISKSQVLDGMEIPCKNEGEIVKPKIAKGNPCVTCVCKSNVVSCSFRTCPKLSCHVEVQEPNASCCSFTCKDCLAEGNRIEPTATWLPVKDSACIVQHCQDGILTRANLQCRTLCSGALPPSRGECCPSCSGCTYGGTLYREGEVFFPKEDDCVECVCKNGRTTCHQKVCPVLACDKENQRVVDNQCCPSCVGSRRIFTLTQGQCWYRRRILQNYQELQADGCTSCICKSGTVICQRKTCPNQVDCPSSERVSKDGCCTTCASDLLKNCTAANGNVLLHGDSWTKEGEPCVKCSCRNGTVACRDQNCSTSDLICPPGQIPSRMPGHCCKVCIEEPGICTVFGDPHYRTFDGRPFNFQGSCKYVLAKDCLSQRFSVVVQNDAKKSRSISWTKNVYLILNVTGAPLQISLHQRSIAKVNGHRKALPYFNSQAAIYVDRGYLKVRTTQGVLLNWDGDNFLEVGASSRYHSVLCGLCGNFNGFTRDDFVGGDGFFKFEKNEFANSWKVGTSEDCTRPQYGSRPHEPCDKNVFVKLRARQQCFIFKSAAFQPCYREVDPTEYYKSCLIDTCECPRHKRCACESIRAYTSACARRGVRIDWNKRIFCKKTCTRGRVYSECGPPCKLKCRNYKNKKRNKKCKKLSCVAGCHCPAGYVLHRSRCIKPASCPKGSENFVRPPKRTLNPFESILMRRGSGRHKSP